MDLAPLELAVTRLRDMEAAVDAARADVELDAVLAVRRGADVAEVAELTGLNPHDLLRMEELTDEIPGS
ncbi:hypothetical protein OG698_38445 [Streptomyces sp. NBC_01003]|uniref:hypothetical protein n=1 Tax=Streptomyces sp. NBC_01003 TaxID=2903714 RepID=UPI0038650243|nr:hypothetical protein OG698_38445 [Streptomyces sp. NBC_01003]